MVESLEEKSINKVKSDFLSTSIVEKEFKNNPYAKYLVYKVDGLIVGYVYYSSIYERVEINQIEVAEEYRNQKIASKLLENLINIENKSITLEVKEDNIPAIRLYEKYNFVKKTIRKGYYQGIDGILMERNIKNKDSF